MSKFFSKRYTELTPYSPGEQPKGIKCIKLNANESPFPPCESAIEFAGKNVNNFNVYPELKCKDLRSKLASMYGVTIDEVITTNGSDELLNFAFMAFCDDNTPAIFPSITYSFYPVLAKLNHIEYIEVPLKADFTIDVKDYFNRKGTIFIANPNAPTGLLLSVSQIEEIIKNNPESVVIIDEAYIDFGGESVIPLIHKYDNLLVCQTFSKSRSLAGARLGYGIGSKVLINDLNTIKYSINPYNVNNYTMALGLGVLENQEYFTECCKKIIANREYTTKELRKIGFDVIDSSTNFVFATNPNYDSKILFEKLREKGVLIRYFDKEILNKYLRITIGTREEMDIFLSKIKEAMGEM